MSNSYEFKTIDQQIEILEHRGLQFNDEDRAKRYLLTNNYYAIVNGYSKYFQSRSDHFIKNANFDEICHLFFYDKELKQVFFNSILTAEHHLKSSLAYRFSEAYPNQRYAYLNTGSYKEQDVLEVVYLISKLSSIVRRAKQDLYRSKSTHRQRNSTSSERLGPAPYYIQKHHDIPLWVLVDYLDFGDVVTMISQLPDAIVNRIAEDMKPFLVDNVGENNMPFFPNTLNSFIANIHETRNICAHGNRLIDFRCRASSVYYQPLHEAYGVQPDKEKNSVYDVFLSLQCFLSKTEYCTLYNSVLKRTKSMNKQLCSITINDILKLLGFPSDWHIRPKLTQSK